MTWAIQDQDDSAFFTRENVFCEAGLKWLGQVSVLDLRQKI